MSTTKNTVTPATLDKQDTSTASAPTTPDKVYNVYKSTMQAHKVIRTDGKVCHVTNGKYITDDAKDIEFIDAEIEAGFQYLRLEKQVTAAELDPIATLRNTLKEEAKEELMQELKLSGVKLKLNPLSTAALTTSASSSDSSNK